MGVPLVILTGFLGAGKTTALNRILRAPLGRRVAVIVNDLGKIDIDRQLLADATGDMVELGGGCVCCELDVNRDLWETLPALVERAKPDVVVLETTGVAEPAVLVAGATVHGLLPRVACVIDASTPEHLDRHEEARAQAAGADGILLTKLDVAAPPSVLATHAAIDPLNAEVARVAVPDGAVGDAALARWLLAELKPRDRRPGASGRKTQLVAASVRLEPPLLEAPLRAMITRLGDRLVRVKGWAWIAGEDRRVWVEKAGHAITIEPREPWGEGARASELVFIGALDELEITRQVRACSAAVGVQTTDV